MEIRTLRYFLAVAREENITKAANLLHITQPNLSRQIKDLEYELGKKLFLRKSHRVILTSDGMLFRKRAEEIIALVDKTEKEFSDLEDEVSGDVYIGGGETYIMSTIAKVIRQIQDRYPRIHFHLYSGNAADVIERLDKGLLDFGVVIDPVDISKYDDVKLRGKDTWGIIMRQDDELAKFEAIRKEDIIKRKLIISRQLLTNDDEHFKKWSTKDYDELDIVATYNLLYNASILVKEKVGIALTLDRLVDTSKENGLTFRALTPTLNSELSLIYKKYQVFPKAAELFLEMIKKVSS